MFLQYQGPVKLVPGPPPAISHQSLTQWLVHPEAPYLSQEILKLVLLEEQAVGFMRYDAGNASGAAGDDGNPGSIGFAQNTPHGLDIPGAGTIIGAGPAGKNKQVTTPIVFVNLVVRNISCKYGVISDTEIISNSFAFVAFFTISHDDQASIGYKGP